MSWEELHAWLKRYVREHGVHAQFIQADSHVTKETYVVPVLTDEQIVAAYNGIMAGNNVFIVDDLEFIVIPVLDASSIEEDVSVTAMFRDKLILTYQVGAEVVATPIGGKLKPYLSLERRSQYLYDVTFLTVPEDTNVSSTPGGCSAYVQNGKLYRNLDFKYNRNATFHVILPNMEGLAFVDGLTDEALSDELIGQLPYHIVDGVNPYGIRVSTHILYNDWDFQGHGEIPLTKLPYLTLHNVRSMTTIAADLADVLSDLQVPSTMVTAGYLLQVLVTDGTTTYCLAPKTDGSGSYEAINITSNPKLTNFLWVNSPTVNRASLQEHPTGVERWNMMPCSLSDLRFTLAYEAPNRLSEFIGIDGTDKDSTDEELEVIYNRAHAVYLDRERDGETWQTMHSVVYSSTGIEHLWIQEDWNRDYARPAIEAATSISDSPSDDKFPTEKAIYDYIASGNQGNPRFLDAVDLNTINKTGFYFCNICTNRPVTANGILIVSRMVNTTAYVVQVYLAFAEDKVYVRFKDNTTWKSWERIYNKTDVDNLLADINLAIEDLDDNKLDKQQGTDNAGKVLGIGNDGTVVPVPLAQTFIFKGYVSSTQPSSAKAGDLWYQSATMPTAFPVQVKTYDGAAWSTGTTAYTPTSLDMWADLENDHGYYWFGNAWNIIDVNVAYDDVTIGLNAQGQLMVKTTFSGQYRTAAAQDTIDAGKLGTSGDGSNVTAAFTQAASRTNISTGEKLSVLFGKIAKWFADLKTVAFSGSYNDLSNKPMIPTVPTNVSAFTNDAGYLTQHQSLAAYRTASAQDTIDNNQNTAINGKESKGKITIGGVEKTANSHTVTIVTNGVTTNLTLVGVS